MELRQIAHIRGEFYHLKYLLGISFVRLFIDLFWVLRQNRSVSVHTGIFQTLFMVSKNYLYLQIDEAFVKKLKHFFTQNKYFFAYFHLIALKFVRIQTKIVQCNPNNLILNIICSLLSQQIPQRFFLFQLSHQIKSGVLSSFHVQAHKFV